MQWVDGLVLGSTRGLVLGSAEAARSGERRLLTMTVNCAAQSAELESRLEATSAAGGALGIDSLNGLHRLNAIERTTLLLCTHVALDEDIECAICSSAPATLGFRMSPEFGLAALELDSAARATEGRSVFAPTAPPLLNDPATLTLGKSGTPCGFRSAALCVTQRAFDNILGAMPIG